MASKRKNPVEERMSRSDSLASMSEFGKIVPLSKQKEMRVKSKPMNIMDKLKNALRGGK